MRKRLIRKFTKAKEGSLGYTLTELLVVIAIIAILCAIAIPSIIAISRALRFKQRNDYAKSIFLAAQQNLTEMRSDGGLAPLQGTPEEVNSVAIPKGHCGFPDSEWSDEYVYTASKMGISGAQRDTYALVLPVGSIDATLREQQVIIEYNPITGNVYSVFYSEEADQDILALYQDGTLPRDAAERKKIMLGYYCGTGLSSSEIELEESAAEIEFTNGEEGIVTVKVPMPSVYFGKYNAFVDGLEVTLEITGSESATAMEPIVIKAAGEDADKCSLDVDGKTILIDYVLDSLVDYGSFANLATGTNGADSTSDPEGTQRATSKKYLTSLKASDFEEKILPGENVDLLAEVKFTRSGSNPAVKIEDGILAGVNPMFDYLDNSGTSNGRYTLAVANGRNLQNLNALHPSIADKVDAVVFTSDINWNDTVAYYNVNHGAAPQTTDATAGTGTSGDNEEDTVVSVLNRKYQSMHEAPARALPYFVPIHNEKLFGTAYFAVDAGQYNNFWDALLGWLQGLGGGSATQRSGIPVLSDANDMRKEGNTNKTYAQNHATIHGAKHRVYNIKIDTTKYPTYLLDDNYYAGVTSPISADVDRFTGLFGYVNTAINDLYVVNPIVKGYNLQNFGSGNSARPNNPATGALLGAGGFNTQIRNCGVYLENINWAKAELQDYNASAEQTWYGVSGEGAVGGLVGYCKSHRTVDGNYKKGDDDYLAFSNCFAAVNVSGNMRGSSNTYSYGYSNGIGGFIGNSQLTNFYNCYASGNVRGSNAVQTGNYSSGLTKYLGLYYNGARSIGIGGFVGTSHGTRYTNCLATGSARNANGDLSVGGFVGVMCYDETFAYGLHTSNTTVAQHTVFENCYALGAGKNSNFYGVEGFSGTNARLDLEYDNVKAYYVGDYYRLLAPHYMDYKSLPAYNTHYIFKDSYYLYQPEVYRKETYNVQNNKQSNHCASAISYSDLANLLQLRSGAENLNGWLLSVKQWAVDLTAIKPIAEEMFSGLTGFVTVWNEIIRNGDRYEIYFNLAKRLHAGEYDLEQIYKTEYGRGFAANDWTPRAQRTHYYGDAAGRVYPFPMIEGLDYYGDWPTQSLSAGIAYYEEYKETNGNTFGYYLERQDNASLKNESIYPIVSDGYAIMTASNVRPTVKINGKDIAVPQTCNHSGRLMDKDQQNQQVYYAWHLNMDQVKAAVYEADGTYGSDYYVPVSVWVGSEFYTLYMNPNVAIGHVNDKYSNLADIPLPDSVKIRTARQFAAMSTMDSFWNMDYVQQLNIDAATYYPANSIPTLAPIGTEETPFTGSYDGNGGYVEMAVLTGFAPAVNENTAGYFGVLGGNVADADGNVSVKGSVSNLTVNQNGATVNDVANAGILAGISNGEINNVTLNATGEVTLTASESAGLLVGKTSGSIVNTLVSATGTTEVSATGTTDENTTNGAGGVVGYAEGATILDSEAALTGGLSSTAVNAGGFVGAAEESTFQNIKVTGFNRQDLEQKHNLSFNADNAGGFAGMISGGQVTTVDVALTMDNSNSKTGGFMGGAVGKAENGTFTNISTVIPYLGNVIGDTAGGMFGSVTGATVRGSDVTVKHRITGKTKAGGFAGVVGEGDKVIENTFVKVIAGIIGSEGQAAGFAVDFGGKTNGVGVQLGEYGGYNADTGSSQPDEMGSIFGITEAAGFACTVTGQVNTGSVKGNGQICISDLNGVTTAAAGKAAGFAITLGDNGRIAASYVTPAMDNTAEDYLGKSNDNLKVKGGDAAGFVMDVTTDMDEDNTGIDGSFALCKLEGNTVYGFVGSNAGRINGSMANVTIPVGGYAFTGDNTGIVANCYGWFGETTADGTLDTAVDFTRYPGHEGETGKYTSCYFIDIKLNEGLANGMATARLFDNKGDMSDVKASKVRDSLDQLNPSEVGATKEWRVGGTQVSCPYASDLAGEDYPYPELRSHYGNWLVPPQYSYGVAYYEAYASETEDGAPTYKFHVIDLSVPAEGAAVESRKLDHTDTFDNTGSITDAGYVLFCEQEATPFKNGIQGDPKNLPTTVFGQTNGKYKFYEFAENADHEITVVGSRGLKAAVMRYYADAFAVSETVNGDAAFADGYKFNIRTKEQLSNVGERPAKHFEQTHDISGDSFKVIPEFTGSYDGKGLNITMKNGTAWMNSMSGTVAGVDLDITGDVTEAIFGTIGGNVGLVDLDILGNVAAVEGGAGGAVVGELTGGFLCPTISVGNVDTKLFGDIGSGGAVVGAVANDNVTVTGGTAITTKTVSGKIFDSVTGGTVVLGDVTVNSTADAKTLFGAISGSKVSGGTVELGSAKIDGNLFAGVTNSATVSGFQVKTTGDMTGALVGGELTGMLSGVSVNAGKVASADAEKPIHGVLVASVADGSTVTGCGVTANAVETAASPFGGLTGSNAGTLSGNTVNITALNVSGTTVGGLVGKNTGAISGANSVNTAIRYTGNGGVTIGGIVGEMTAGSLTTTKTDAMASGSIVPANAVSGVNNIGGAIGIITGGSVGSDDTSVSQNVVTAVAVDGAWGAVDNADKTFGSSGITNYGPVGMFVGKAGNVTLTNCSSTAANTKYQFLGHATMGDPATVAAGSWYATDKNTNALTAYSDEANTDGSYNATYKDPETSAVSTVKMMQGVTSVNKVATNLINCKFVMNSATRTQTYGADTYFYTQKETTELKYTIGTSSVEPKSSTETVTLYASKYNATPTPTGKYFVYPKDGKYYQASVKYERTGSDRSPNFTFTIVATNDTSLELHRVNYEWSWWDLGDLLTGRLDPYAKVTFTNFTKPTLNGKYTAINNEEKMFGGAWETYAIPNGRVIEQRNEDLLGCIWNATDSKIGNATTNVQLSGDVPVMEYVTDSHTFQLYPVTEGTADYTLLTFTYQDNADHQRQFITYTPMENGASVVSLEEEVPVTEATEATEATAVTTETTTPAGETGGEIPGTEG